MTFDWITGLHPLVIIIFACFGLIYWALKRLLGAMLDAVGEDLWAWLRDELHRRRHD